MRDVQLGSRAARDLRKIKDDRARRDVGKFLKDELTADPHPDNMEVRDGFETGYLVARIVDRKELQKAVRTLAD